MILKHPLSIRSFRFIDYNAGITDFLTEMVRHQLINLALILYQDFLID